MEIENNSNKSGIKFITKKIKNIRHQQPRRSSTQKTVETIN